MNPSGIDANESVAHRSSGALLLDYLQRYGLAVVSIGVAVGVSQFLQHFHFHVPLALLLLFAVAISSWYGGLGPAVLAVILSTIGFYWYLVEPVRTIYIYWSEVPYFIIFAAFAALLSWFGMVRRRGEAELGEQAALVNLTHDTVFVMDMDGVIKYWNRGAEERYGWTADQAAGRVVHDLLKTIFPAPLDEIKARVTRTGLWEGEVLHTKKDGTQLVAASRWSLERGRRGDPVAILETNNDITERKRAEEELRQSEAELRQLVDVIPQQVFVFDVDWSPVFANRRELEYTGLTSEEMQSKDEVARIFHPEDLKKLEVARERARSDGAPFEMEARIRGKDGGHRWFLIRDNPLCDEQGRILRWYGTRTDIEDRKRAEEARSKAQADLAHVNRVSLLGELAASIAHEVNQPLSGVVSNASACLRWLAAESPDLEEVREATHDIVRDGKRAGEVVARIRALTRMAAVPKEKLDLNETIREVLTLVGDEARRNSVIVQTQFAEDLSSVAGDRVQLQQVVLNLVMNAMEAMSNVGDRLRELVISTRNVDADHVQATVEDSGIGLDANTIGKIFGSFYTTKPGGMGMGLSICRSIVQAHGGRIWAVGKDGPGTIFHFTVPKYHHEGSNGRVEGV